MNDTCNDYINLLNFQYPQVFKIKIIERYWPFYSSIIINYYSNQGLSVGCLLLILWFQIAACCSNANWALLEKQHIAFIITATTTVTQLYSPHRWETPAPTIWISVSMESLPYMVSMKCGCYFGCRGSTERYHIHSSGISR